MAFAPSVNPCCPPAAPLRVPIPQTQQPVCVPVCCCVERICCDPCLGPRRVAQYYQTMVFTIFCMFYG
ncbi:unnamed protein product [Adineta ricciae]|uniref:Uncharacterized protein n=1 Tax=Adineta ricciae TaxID=249248 RepID=A0A815N407_ADIRI|nr:unnamed protein product [Adineta ricciae]